MLKNMLLIGVGAMSFVVSGCEDSAPEPPPVMDALDGIRKVRMADAAEKTKAAAAEAMAAPRDTAPIETEGTYVVQFETTAGAFTIEVHRDWAPIGADRFYKLVNDGFYNKAGFFRVIEGFMVQWGLAADSAMNYKWAQEITDDPVRKSNTRGYISFAKTDQPNSRTTQVFINFGDNSNLDTQGFAPFGLVTKGMNSVDNISNVHREDPDQGTVRLRGNSYLKSNFPDLDYVISARIVDPAVDNTAKDDNATDTGDAESATPDAIEEKVDAEDEE